MAPDRPMEPEGRRPANVPPSVHAGSQLTPAEYDAVVSELHALRSRHRAELARRLRDARAFGSPADNDDVLAAFEDSAIAEAQIAKLEDLLRSASIVDGDAAFDGQAGPGCEVRVADDRDRTTTYVLIGRRDTTSGRHHVSLASPVGRALLGCRAGDVVDVALPNGRNRRLTVLEVTAGRLSASPSAREAAEAA